MKIKGLLIMISLLVSFGCQAQNRKFSPEEWKQKFEAYAIDKADLTKEEAAKFFPLYTEMKNKQREYYKNMGKLMKSTDGDNTTEATYANVNQQLIHMRITCEKIESEYLKKFRKVLSNKKIFLVKKADSEFQHQALRRMSGKSKDQQKK